MTLTAQPPSTTDRVRTTAARVVRLVFTLCALVLALGAVLIALRHHVDGSGPLERWLIDVDDAIDGPFSRDDGVLAVTGADAATLEAMLNWGAAALVYLVVGRLLAWVIRP